VKKWILPLLLLVSPYLYAAILIAGEQTGYKMTDLQNSLIIGAIAAIFIVNMVYAFVALKWKSSRELLFWDMLIKLCYIPLYICNFFGGLLALVMPVGFLLVLFVVVIDFLLLLPSTMYGVSGLIKASKEGKIPKGTAVLAIILHFFFCTDVICAVVMYCIVKTQDKKEVTAA
jgi:hypothetical protein